MILTNLGEPKTFPELCELLEEETGIRRPKSSVSYALRELIRRGEVVGAIDEGTLKKTRGKLIPVFKRTGRHALLLGGEPKDAPTDGRDYSIMDLYTHKKGYFIGRQFFKKIKRKHGKGAYAYKRIGPFYLFRGPDDFVGVPLRDIRSIRDLERYLKRKRQR